MNFDRPHLYSAARAARGRDVDPALLEQTRRFLSARRSGVADPAANAAWERFYRTYDPVVRRFARACHVPPSDLPDCVQDVWKEIVARLPQYEHDPQRGRFRTWLYAVVRSKAIDLARRRARHGREWPDLTAAGRMPSADGDPVAEYRRRAMQRAVREVLAELRQHVPERSYRVLYLRWIESRPVGEIAVLLGLTPQQVWFRHHRMKEKFRRLFQQHRGADFLPSG